MNSLIPILLFIALVAALRWLSRRDEDAAAGVLLDPAARVTHPRDTEKPATQTSE